MSGVAVLPMFFEFVGVACVLASGLMPVYSIPGVTFADNHPTYPNQADCELGVWRTTCSWTIGWNSSGTDMPTYNLPYVQEAWVAPVMEAVYTIAIVFGIATMVWQVAAARSACLQAKAHWWRHCEWVLRLFTALLGGVYPLLVWHFGTHFWVVYPTPDEWYKVTVHANDGNFPLVAKPGFFVACVGAISFGASPLILCMEACLKPKRPEAVAVIPEESQPVLGQVINKDVYETCP